MMRHRGAKGERWIVLHDGMPEHPKVEGLSDRAFRALISLWCWCGRHLTDGRVSERVWRRYATASVRRQLVEAKLVDPQPDGGVIMHDYLDWQRSATEVTQVIGARRAAGLRGNHERWHVKEGRHDPTCDLCQQDSATPPKGSPRPSQMRSHMGSQTDRRGEERRGRTTTHLGGDVPESNTRDPHTAAARRLVEAYAASCARRPPGKILVRLLAEVDALLAEQWPEADIAAALDAWGAKALGPGAFAAVAHEVVNRRPSSHAPSTTDARVAAALALGQPTNPSLRAITGGAS